MVASSIVCTIYGNGSYTPGCQSAINHAAPQGLPLMWLPIIVAPIVIFGALFLITKYREHAWGRQLEGFTGIIGIGRTKSGANAIGKVIPFVDVGLALFDPGRGQGKFKRIVTMMPDSIITMPQSYGGISFTLVELDKRTTVDPHIAEWGQVILGQLAKKQGFDRFVFEAFLKDIQWQKEKPRFPSLQSLAPDVKIPIPREMLA